MRISELARSIVPRPRRRVTVWTVLPLALFALAFGAACLYVELASVALFTSPMAFLLSSVFVWTWWMHVAGANGLRGLRSVLVLLVRLTLVALFIVLLAEPRAVRKDDTLSVVYALDISNSIGESAANDALEYVTRTVAEKPERDEAGLVVLGRDASVELPPRMAFPFENAINSRILRDGTDLARGLSLAGAVLPEDQLGRIVLISDGAQTEGALPEVLDELKARGIPVDVLPVRYDYDREVWVERLELPRLVRANETYEASVVVSSLRDGTGTLRLLENGQAIHEGPVHFKVGKNRYNLPIRLRGAGYYQYVAVVDVPEGEDSWEQNNRAIGHLCLRGEGKVLVVKDPSGDARDWQPLVAALTEGGFQVETQPSYMMPSDALSFAPYDCVVLVNVPADALDVIQMEAVRSAVHDQGTGLIMVGGPNSFGAGGYNRTAIEKALPVTMDISQKKVLPKGALAIILHTCEFPEGNTWGKRVAKEAIRVLGAEDEVGVLAYDHQGENWVFEMTPAAEYENLVRLINQAQIGDMPSFSVTMQMGLNALIACEDAMARHMIIISDGDPSPPPPSLLQAFVDAQVSISTVVVFPHADENDPGIATMKGIANATGGRFYYPKDPAQLPSIFVKEAKTLKRNMIQNVVFTPAVQFPSAVLKGIEALPELRGYVLTTAKPRSMTILKGPDAEEVDPVLAIWRYGVGQAAAWTSDLSANWAANWVVWDRYRPFVSQLVTEVSRTTEEGQLRARVIVEGGTATILADDADPSGTLLEVEAAVQGPQGRTETVRLRQVAPQRYEGTFPLWGEGTYQVIGVGEGEGRNERFMAGHVVAYSPEYLRFRADPIVLDRIARDTGGRILNGEETGRDIFVKERIPKASSRPIADLFLLLLAILVPLDVGVRRVQLDWGLIRNWVGLGRGAVASGETFEALLKRKRAVESVTARKDRKEVPLPPRRQPGAEAERPAPARPPAPAERESTLKQLLDRKKKWKEE